MNADESENRGLISGCERSVANDGLVKSAKTKHLISDLRMPSRSAVSRAVKRTLIFLSPTFVQSSLRPQVESVSTKRIHPTAWLDGMRGLAALFVFLDHLSYSTHDVYTAWGTGGGNREFLRLPFVRFFYTGAYMVAIFFVVSGYALSLKPIRQMRNGELENLTQTLSSSVFRRAVRLYLPCFASTFMIIILVRLGIYEWTRELANDPVRLPGRREHHPWRYDTLSEQLSVWAQKMLSFMNPFTLKITEGDHAIDIDGHLWTVSTEYKASLILFVTQLGLCRLQPRFRMLSIVCLMVWAHQTARWDMILFFGGFFLAELDIRRRANAASNTFDNPDINEKSGLVWSTIYVLAFLSGIYLGGQPNRLVEHAPGWALLNSWIPKNFHHRQRYWTGWGGLLLVWSTSNHLPLQRIFTNGVSQYLGKISFSLYLVHGAVIHTVGYGAMDMFWNFFGRETYSQRETGFILAGICVIIVTVWLADLFMRLVDIPTVRLARWLEEKCVLKRQSKEDVGRRDSGKLV